MDNKKLIKILEEIYKNIHEQKDYLNDLDQQIGDGDHGTNVDRGFGMIIADKDKLENMSVKDIMKNVAMILMSKIGGSSGPLLGSLAMQITSNLNDGNTLAEWLTGFEKGRDAIKMLGKSTEGDKTMLDSLTPAINALKENINDTNKALDEAAKAAKKGSDDTKPLEAKKGRAAYLGERSIGHIDPGSVTIALIFKSIDEVVK